MALDAPAVAGLQQQSSVLAQRFAETRKFTVSLCEGLSAEDCQLQSMADASPAKWHLAHTAWFFETFVLADAVSGYRPFHPGFGYLFNSYYDAIGERHARPQRGLLSRPALAEVLDYRQHVDAALLQLLQTDCPPQFLHLIELGIQHEQQHQELLLTDLKHGLFQNPMHPAYRLQKSPQQQASELQWTGFGEGLVEVGHRGSGFSYDNERPRHKHWLAAYELASRPVNNAEFQAFIDDGGYKNPALWLSDAWARVQAQQWRAPLYWDTQQHTEFTLHGDWPRDPAAPVTHLSYYEADAYARWAGARLPTEQEWENAAAEQLVAGQFVDSGCLQPVSPPHADGAGLQQLYGSCWEWTASAYLPYPGFRTAAGAVGEYNGKFMCNQFVLRGGSCASSQDHLRGSYRNFFYPDARWQFSGIRLARDL